MRLQLVMPQAQGPEIAEVSGATAIPWRGVIDLAIACPAIAAGEPAGLVAGNDEIAQPIGDLIGAPSVVEQMTCHWIGHQSAHGGITEQTSNDLSGNGPGARNLGRLIAQG